jgi:hypothetical protein
MPDADAVVISVALDDPVEAAAGLLAAGAPVADDAPLLLVLPPLLQAATMMATAAAPTAMAPIRSTGGNPSASARTRAPAPPASRRRSRVPGLAVIRLLICIFSSPWPIGCPHSLTT